MRILPVAAKNEKFQANINRNKYRTDKLRQVQGAPVKERTNRE
jgi:hypothetical protein